MSLNVYERAKLIIIPHILINARYNLEIFMYCGDIWHRHKKKRTIHIGLLNTILKLTYLLLTKILLTGITS